MARGTKSAHVGGAAHGGPPDVDAPDTRPLERCPSVQQTGCLNARQPITAWSVPLIIRSFGSGRYYWPGMVLMEPSGRYSNSVTFRLRSQVLPPEGTESWWNKYHLPLNSQMQ